MKTWKMDQTSSTENQTAMAPVYGNMANLCLLCASAQNPEGQAFIDIFGKRGMHLRILDKIHKFLSTNIEAGFPLQIDIKEEALDDDWSKMDFDVPSPEADFQNEADDFENHFLQPRKKKGTIEDQQSEEFPTLRQPFLVSEFRLSLVNIKINEPGTYNKESISEKVSRIMQHIKKCVPKKQTKPGGKVESLPTSTALLHSCQSCQCSFFLQEEMVSHFESLHPEEVHQCTVCGENICGSWEIQEKHMELHRALKEVQLVKTNHT
ncbi:hypothetical protein B566_EDAN007297 [Ephemera danica]|nr:hypothetical protein B566_EDAN007297 [Ephemera danica]